MQERKTKRALVIAGIASLVITTLVSVTIAYAANERPGPKEIWHAIDNLQTQIDGIEDNTANSTSVIMFHRAGITSGSISFVSTSGGSDNVFANANIMPLSGKIHNLIGAAENFPPGIGESYTLTLVKNGSDTPLTCSIANTETNCSNASDVVEITVGDRIMMKVTGNTPQPPFQATIISSVAFTTA